MITEKPEKLQKHIKNKVKPLTSNKFGVQNWYCQDCSVLLTSKLQAQEHFIGKKHRATMRSKGHWYIHARSKHQHFMTAKKNINTYARFQRVGKTYLSNYWKPKLSPSSSETVPPPAGKDNILETVINSEKKTFYFSDLSIYRTPSGKYYCQPCNITVNSQTQFLQHAESRKHRHKANGSVLKLK